MAWSGLGAVPRRRLGKQDILPAVRPPRGKSLCSCGQGLPMSVSRSALGLARGCIVFRADPGLVADRKGGAPGGVPPMPRVTAHRFPFRGVLPTNSHFGARFPSLPEASYTVSMT